MVYESDFYTTRRYRTSPSVSSYTSTTVPSRQVRILPGLGKVHIVHSYDRIVPYVGHKRLTVVSVPPKVYATRPSVLQREYDWIENRVRPWVGYSATNRYLNSDSAVRISYVPYPITGVNYYTTYSTPSYGYYPKLYRWYYNWPRDTYYWPYRRYLSTYLNLWPLYNSVDSTFSKLEYDIDNLRRMIFLTSPVSTIDYSYYPETTKYYRPLTLHYNYYWPLRALNYYSNYWPSYGYWPSYRYNKYLSWPSDRYWYLQKIFDDETRLIRAQSESLLKRIHSPIPRVQKVFPITTYRYEDALPARLSNDNYIHKMLTSSPINPKVEYTTYWSEPVRKYIGQGHLSCVSYAGDRAYPRRRNVWLYEDPVRSDIQLLSYYIQKFRQDKAQQPKEVPLNPARASRRFNAQKADDSSSTSQEMKELRDAREARLARIYAEEPRSAAPTPKASENVDEAVKAKKQKEEARLAEEKALAEEQARLAAQAKKEEAERKAELARQEQLAAQAAAEKAAELERQAELARQEELAKQAEIEKAKQLEEERLRQEEQKRLDDEAKAEEERKQLLRLEELARQAEEEKEAELRRQAEELAELARQEAEIAEQAKKEQEEAELARQQAELEELERQEAELAELERQERELMEQARIEAEAAERAKLEADAAQLEAKLAILAQEQAERERDQAELEALEAEERALQAEQEAESEEVAAEEETAEPEAAAEPEAPTDEVLADEAVDEEEEPHAIAEDVPETVPSDVEPEPEVDEEEEEEE